jgi:hypothetical protein
MKSIKLDVGHPVGAKGRVGLGRTYLGYILLFSGFVLIGLVLAWLALKANRVYAGYELIRQEVATLQASQAQPNVAQARASVRVIATELELLSTELAPFMPLMPYLGWVPTYGGDLQALPVLLRLGRDLGRVALFFDQALPALEAGVDQGGLLPALATGLAGSAPELARLEMALRQDQARLNQLDPALLSPQLGQRVEQIEQYLPLALTGLKLAQGLPELLGVESPRTYLILTQSLDELRPTGGYINAAGHLTFDKGEIVEFVMQDSYAVDQLSESYPYPPEPIRQYMGADYWLLRDANWSPDFPTSARTAIILYQMGQGLTADGVIALDQQALSYVVRAVEPLPVEGDQVTADNLIPLMRQRWAPEPGQDLDGEWWLQRKSFMLTLAETLQHKFLNDLGSVKLPVLAEAIRQALAEKHLLLYLNDPAWAEVLAEHNMSGLVREAPADYLMVVDANLGFNKASAIVERRLRYRLALDEAGGAQAHANLMYHHPAAGGDETCSQQPRYDPTYEQNMERCYWNYLRLIVPAGVRLERGPSVVVNGQNLLRQQPTTGKLDIELLAPNKQSWGQLFLLPPQEIISLDYIYSLPPGTARQVDNQWHYNLYLQKQPGLDSSAVEVTVSLPAGAQLVESQPLPASQVAESLTFLLDLKMDMTIDLFYTLP